jgi:UDP-glucose 4-epimerase
MRFLITGGAGFIGSTLANHLVREGHHVRVLDDLSAGCDPARLDPKVLFTRGDVRDVPKLWTLLQKVHCVYHLAARVYVEQSVLYPREYNDVNVGGTVAVMEAMRDAGVKRVVLASSGAIYGEQAVQPVKEIQPPNPQSPYAFSTPMGQASRCRPPTHQLSPSSSNRLWAEVRWLSLATVPKPGTLFTLTM